MGPMDNWLEVCTVSAVRLLQGSMNMHVWAAGRASSQTECSEGPCGLASPSVAIIQPLLAPASSSSRMRVIYHNWSAMKQRPHPQSVAKISRHSVLSGDRIRQCETSSGSRHKDTDQCL